jgi:hypothetical protein
VAQGLGPEFKPQYHKNKKVTKARAETAVAGRLEKDFSTAGMEEKSPGKIWWLELRL